MSGTDPIAPDSPLGRALHGADVPDLPADFADRVIARARNRPAPLPDIRRSGGGVGRWRSARRLGIGLAVSGALATAAAATGLLGDDWPSPARLWNAITGQAQEPVAALATGKPASATDSTPQAVPKSDASVIIDGPIDTPEELEEAFRRVDAARENRRALRRENVDRRIDEALERRRAQGLPAPTPEEEAELRARIERARERKDARTDQRIEQRRDDMRNAMEQGETISRDTFQRPAVTNPVLREKLDELRDLPPAERRQRLRELREQRQQRLQQQSAPLAPAESTPPQGER